MNSEYEHETFTASERAILERYFTNLDGPVFALVNLPEVVKGALFARYSRSSKSLRRLFLDEFSDDLEGGVTLNGAAGLARAEQLYEKVFFEYGDDSVAQLGGVHLACEQASNVLTKILERGRLMSYLEQSTRYIAYDEKQASGRYRYYRPAAVLSSPLGVRYVTEMDGIFEAYSGLLDRMTAWIASRYPRQPADSDAVHRRAVRAKALDSVRGLLPAAAVSNLGIYASGQAYEHLLLRMRAHPLPEARHYADLMLVELRKVIPSFLQRVDRPERGGEWSAYLADTERRAAEVLERLHPACGGSGDRPEGPSVSLVDFDLEGEAKVLAAICFARLGVGEAQARQLVDRFSEDERADLMAAYVGDRRNRRHKPGRAFERTDYRFELVTDYGAFRDLQRHRMLSIEWQPLSTELGYDLPELVEEAGEGASYAETMERSAVLSHALSSAGLGAEAPYAVALGYRVRYVLQMNAREAMHLIELRSGPQGHPSYRRAAQAMHRAIADVAGHRLIAGAMSFTDHSDAELERLEAERRAEARHNAQAA